MVKVLLTGGAGFIGHHVVGDILRGTDWRITIIDRLDHSGNLNRLSEIGLPNPRVKFLFHDLRAPFNDQLMSQIGEHDYIIHMAASTHVDRSITDPLSFVHDNVLGTAHMLEFARGTGCSRFVYFSTDEVFGPAPPGVSYKEDDRYRSGNPYAATKAGAEELAVAYHNTYGTPVIVTHTMNVIGPRQSPEKFVPMTIGKVRDSETVTIHADQSCKVPGSRFYIDAEEVAVAVRFLLETGEPGEKYNVCGSTEMSNLEMAQDIAAAIGRPLFHEMVDFHSSRPGHDLRYALDGSKLAALGFSPRKPNIERIVRWYIENEDKWLAPRKQRAA